MQRSNSPKLMEVILILIALGAGWCLLFFPEQISQEALTDDDPLGRNDAHLKKESGYAILIIEVDRMRIAVCDDEKYFLDMICDLINSFYCSIAVICVPYSVGSICRYFKRYTYRQDRQCSSRTGASQREKRLLRNAAERLSFAEGKYRADMSLKRG